MIRVVVAGVAAAWLTSAGQADPQPRRPVVFSGCVQQTADPDLFLLAVPGSVPDPVRGIAKGDPVPPGAGAGPAPRALPGANPPVRPDREPRRPEGRYSTPSIVNRSYKLLDADAARLRPLVGKAIEVTGEVTVAGFPSGDAPAGGVAAQADAPLNPPLWVKSFKLAADSCVALIRSK